MINPQDKEIQAYRDLMKVPDRFEGAFGPKMIIAAIFLGFLMVPGSIYLSLFTGQSMGPAAQWVTVILFAEVARRSMKSLKTQEVYLLYYMTGIALAGGLAGGIHGGVLSQLLWNQYFVRSPAAQGMGIASEIPWWVAPQAEYITSRTFFTMHWMPPIMFIMGTMIIGRIDQFGLGYALYRWTAHVEKLPFPMAPAGALGITALAEAQDRSERWRWRCFSLGAVLGLGFGFIYVGVPAISGVLLGRSIQIIPLPWIDFTKTVSTREFMPAVPLNLVFDVTFIILGMVLPFWAVVGGAVGLVITWILNPVLQRNGMLPSWEPGMGLVDTVFSNTIDFYLSFSIGLALAIFLASVAPIILMVYRSTFGKKKAQTLAEQELKRDWRVALRELMTRNRERGDISIIIALAIYVCSSIGYILICVWLMPGTEQMQYRDRFPWLFFLGFAFIYQPIISYTSAKLEGMVGQFVSIPLVREAAFILSGYKGAAIWFAPIPINDYGRATQHFRVLELTGTKLTDVIKVELVALPILALTSLLFCELIWHMAPVPGPAYPYTIEVWDLAARNYALAVTSTSEGSSMFLEAIKFDIIAWGIGVGLGSFALFSFLNLPTFLIFGAVRGFNQTVPGALIFELLGAIVGRLYLEKKFGHQKYKQYVMILFAGFSAGMGLIGMASVAIALIVKSTAGMGY